MKRIWLVALVAGVSFLIGVIVLSFLGQTGEAVLLGENALPLSTRENLFSKIEIGSVLVVGSFLTTVLIFLLGRFFRLRELADGHACRERPVKMLSAGDTHMTFRFYHPLYADRFADSNSARTLKAATMKAPRGVGIVTRTTLASTLLPSLVLAGIGHAIALSVIQDAHQQRSLQSTVNTSSTPSKQIDRPQSRTPSANGNRSVSDPVGKPPPRSVSPPALPPTYTQPGLAAKIDDGKARARALESQLAQLDAQLDSMQAQVNESKASLADYERRIRLGIDADESAYEQTRLAHNSLVRQYNSLIERRKTVYTQYELEIESVNEMVRRYNAGER